MIVSRNYTAKLVNFRSSCLRHVDSASNFEAIILLRVQNETILSLRMDYIDNPLQRSPQRESEDKHHDS